MTPERSKRAFIEYRYCGSRLPPPKIPDRQDLVDQWLATHQPTRCPTVAVAATTAHAVVGPLPLPIMKKGSQRGKPKEDKPKVSKSERQRQRRLAKRGGRQYLPSVPMVGKTFAELTVLRHAFQEGEPNRRTYWTCQCSCGATKDVDGYELRRGKIRSCGHLSRNRAPDRRGRRYGSWTVVGQVPRPEHLRGNDTYWHIRCDCGQEKIVRSASLRYYRFEDGPCKHLKGAKPPSDTPPDSETPESP